MDEWFCLEFYWIATAAFADIDESERCIISGRVSHSSLSSFTAELYALLRAVAGCSSPVHVFIDCLSVVDIFHELIRTQEVHPQWSHGHWWHLLLQIWKDRSCFFHKPIKVTWIPANQSDDVLLQGITQDFAEARGLKLHQARGNRIADNTARDLAWSLALGTSKIL